MGIGVDEVWGVWCEDGRCWAEAVPGFAIEFLTEPDAARTAAEWSDREPARRHGWTWVAKRRGGLTPASRPADRSSGSGGSAWTWTPPRARR